MKIRFFKWILATCKEELRKKTKEMIADRIGRFTWCHRDEKFNDYHKGYLEALNWILDLLKKKA